jgi:perosamine synthetase
MPSSGVESRIPLSEPFIDGNEWEYVKECLDTGWVSSAGAFVDRFESGIRDVLGIEEAVATSSGTSALHLALLAVGVKPDDEVLVSSLTFIAPANAVRYTGAHPVFVDASPDSWQMDIDLVEDFLVNKCKRTGDGTLNLETGRRVIAVVPVHILGLCVDMGPLLSLADRYGLKVIEDATEGLGAKYEGESLGTMGDIGCLSFNGNKLITSGGGGMAVTRSADLAKRMRYLSTQAKDDAVEYVHFEVGFNYRLTNVQAAIGYAQLETLDQRVQAKKRIANFYERAVQTLDGLRLMPSPSWCDASYWLSTVTVDPQICSIGSRGLMGALRERGIETRPLWQPLHLSRAQAGNQALGGTVSEHLNRVCLSLPSSVGITDDELSRVSEAIRRAI